MAFYKALNKQIFSLGNFSLIPIRVQDRYDIMKWRNEQLFHLRQRKPLTRRDQDNYFKTVVAALFEKEQPEQILFSYLENGICVGYGGLVHISWSDRNAELSFIIDTSLERENFSLHWKNFSHLIQEVAFQELKMHKIFTYSFNLRPHVYSILEEEGFICEAELKEHHIYNNEFINVKIHSKFSDNHKR